MVLTRATSTLELNLLTKPRWRLTENRLRRFCSENEAHSGSRGVGPKVNIVSARGYFDRTFDMLLPFDLAEIKVLFS